MDTPSKLGGSCCTSTKVPLSDTVKDCIAEGWTCCQVFLGPCDDAKNRRKLTKEDRNLCSKLSGEDNTAFRVYSHFPFNMNLVTALDKQQLAGLQGELNTLYKFKGIIVIHPNSAGGPKNKDNVDKESKAYVKHYRQAIDTMMANLKKLKLPGDGYSILLEGPAGEGSKIGWSFQQLKYIVKQLKANDLQDKVGFCMDTCHNFCAGLSKFNTSKAVDKYFEKLDTIGVLPYVKAIHLNDSKEPFGAFKDRHELLCMGKIWKGNEDGFIAFVTSCAKYKLDIICETDGYQGVPLCRQALEVSTASSESLEYSSSD